MFRFGLLVCGFSLLTLAARADDPTGLSITTGSTPPAASTAPSMPLSPPATYTLPNELVARIMLSLQTNIAQQCGQQISQLQEIQKIIEPLSKGPEHHIGSMPPKQ